MFGVFWHGIVLIGMLWYALECILSIIVKFMYFSLSLVSLSLVQMSLSWDSSWQGVKGCEMIDHNQAGSRIL